MEQSVCHLPLFVEGSIIVTQLHLVLPLLDPEPKIAAILQEVFHEAQH